ncbi:MAG TPA: helix-turn-helix transcriptional regulator [Kofleriaceae bacterium]|jgi:DNA-binding CsgD family transcriptional regulator|nr:helix-turn-helix transcriptional regulator [Kofleriaceae bacterium]
MPSRSKADLITLLESIYELEVDVEVWLQRVLETARVPLDHGLGVLGFLYDASVLARMQLVAAAFVGNAPMTHQQVIDTVARFPPGYVESTFRALPCALARDASGIDPIWQDVFEPMGIHDVFNVNGVDPTGHGFYIGGFLGKRGRLTPELRQTWSRIATHLATSYRLRRHLSGSITAPAIDGTEAILKPDGRVDHAEEPARDRESIEQLSEAVKARERARGSLRRRDPHQAVREWRGLIATRWTLVDHFETGGQRYFVARRNDPRIEDVSDLTLRERQAVAFASLGHTNKLIAYEMGISASTVGVLLHRAARKLEAATRGELLTRFMTLSRPAG